MNMGKEPVENGWCRGEKEVRRGESGQNAFNQQDKNNALIVKAI